MLTGLSLNARIYPSTQAIISSQQDWVPAAKSRDSYVFSEPARWNASAVTVRSPGVLSAQKLSPAQSLQTELFKLLRERVVIPENYFSDLIASLEAKNDIFVPTYRRGMVTVAKRAVNGLIDPHEAFFSLVKFIHYDRFAQLRSIPGLLVSNLAPLTPEDGFYHCCQQLLTRHGHSSEAIALPFYYVSLSRGQDAVEMARAKRFYDHNFYANYRYFYGDLELFRWELDQGACPVLAPELLWYMILKKTHPTVKLEISAVMPSRTDDLTRGGRSMRPGVLNGCNQELQHYSSRSNIAIEDATPIAALEHDLTHLMMWGFHDYPEFVLALFHRIAVAVHEGFKDKSFDQINQFIIYDVLLDVEKRISGFPSTLPQAIISALADILKKLMSRMQAEVDVSKQSVLRSEIRHFIVCVTNFFAHENFSNEQAVLERCHSESTQDDPTMKLIEEELIKSFPDFVKKELNRHWKDACASALRDLS